jgi:dienelactone hydrolase
MARDLSLALRLVAGGKLAGGVISVDGRKVGVLGHSIGGGTAVLAASSDPAIRAVMTVTAAQTKPSALDAAGNVLVPGLHVIGDRDPLGAEVGKQIAKNWAGPVQLRRIRKAEHFGLAEGRHWTTALTGDGHEKRIQEATRVLASAFFLRHLAGQDQLADDLEAKIAGTVPESLTDDADAESPTG